MERLMMRARPGRLTVFKLEPARFGPSEDDACPWQWECYPAHPESSSRGPWCSGGSGTTWREAMDRGRTHAERVHGVTW